MKSEYLTRTLLALSVALGALGCESASTTDVGICQYTTPVVKKSDGKLHGEPCDSDAECKYGTCTKAAMQLGGAGTKGVCTKQCSCGGATSVCGADDVTGKVFKCIKAPTGAGSECALSCASAADCMAVNPDLKYCISSSSKFQTGVKVCSATPQS